MTRSKTVSDRAPKDCLHGHRRRRAGTAGRRGHPRDDALRLRQDSAAVADVEGRFALNRHGHSMVVTEKNTAFSPWRSAVCEGLF